MWQRLLIVMDHQRNIGNSVPFYYYGVIHKKRIVQNSFVFISLLSTSASDTMDSPSLHAHGHPATPLYTSTVCNHHHQMPGPHPVSGKRLPQDASGSIWHYICSNNHVVFNLVFLFLFHWIIFMFWYFLGGGGTTGLRITVINTSIWIDRSNTLPRAVL